MSVPDSLSSDDLERVRRAADRLDEALEELGLTRGAPQVKRALELLEGVDGVDPVESESATVDRLCDLSSQLPAGRRAMERRAEA